jgi:putative beta-lysine N-acetyltransferase
MEEIMPDIVQKIGNSVIHHGKNSNRIYIMSLDKTDLPQIIDKLDELANQNGYSKIVAKIPVDDKEIFETNAYEIEAVIPDFFNEKKDGCFICKYFSENRKIDPHKDECKSILDRIESKPQNDCYPQLNKDFICRQATKKDAQAITEVYKKVFKSYPFPIYDQAYILKSMEENVIYFGIWHHNELVALSSIELYKNYSNAEMTDFAVIEEYRGNGFAQYLLVNMEKKLSDLGIKTAYTIARAKSPGMNITFSKNGYIYAGTLINNTDISGQIESMNVWYKMI